MTDPAKPLRIVPRHRPIETRWPCPVCLGVTMEKADIGRGAAATTVDYCTRCGGLWFDRGEVGVAARARPAELREFVPERIERVRPPCHGCQTPLDRDADRCAVCGRANVLRCPVCDETMERRAHGGVALDLCRRCHGVWFDNAELSAIWRLNVDVARRGRGADALATGGDVLLSAMFWTPDLVVYGGMAAGHAVGAAAEVAGSAAEGVFSTIMEIIGSLFE
jgi:Zn-finger nucleic acid-binding protein